MLRNLNLEINLLVCHFSLLSETKNFYYYDRKYMRIYRNLLNMFSVNKFTADFVIHTDVKLEHN